MSTPFVVVTALALLCVETALAQQPIAQMGILTKHELQQYSDLQKKLYPTKGDIYSKVTQLFGDHETYTADQITAATDPTIKTPFNYEQRQKEERDGVPIDAFTQEQAKEQFASYEKLHPKAANLWGDLVAKYGLKAWYRADELRDVEDNGKELRKADGERPPDDPIEQQLMAAQLRRKTFLEDFRVPRIRQSWRDVLYDEDRSQTNQTKVLKDLVGATFSYTHDGKADTNAWTVNGALIFPWEHDYPLTGGIRPARIAVAPSVTLNKLDTTANASNDVDSLLFRLGFYGDWTFHTPEPTGIQIRAAPVFVTDTKWHGKLPGYEVDLEPRWQNPCTPIGYKKILVKKEPLLADESDKSCLDFQLRTWLHLEGGDVQDTGKSWATAKGHFFRLGPSVQLQLNAPRLVWGKDFSITTLYTHQSATSGSNAHPSFFQVSGVLDLFKDDQFNRKVSITAQYQKGGLSFTKQDVDIFTLGVGILF